MLYSCPWPVHFVARKNYGWIGRHCNYHAGKKVTNFQIPVSNIIVYLITALYADQISNWSE